MFKKKSKKAPAPSIATIEATELETVGGGWGQRTWTIHRVNTCSFDNPYGRDYVSYD